MASRPPSFAPAAVISRTPVTDEPSTPAAPEVTEALADRLGQRRRARRRLRIRALLICVISALLLAGIGYLSLLSPVLALRAEQISVQGSSEYVSAEQVRAIAAGYVGVPLLRLDTAEIVSQTEDLVGVREASVRRDFPNGIQITVVPRVPVASVGQGDLFVTLDSEGVELAQTDAPAADVPLVHVPVGTEGTVPALAAVLEVLAVLPPQLLEQVGQVSASSAHEVEFTLDSGAQVVWGSAQDSVLKATVLEILLQVEAQVYDVSAPNNPITR
ncbi:MAG: cell division protein FtsQ/DivIB [Beutenbergiaceae bacterium]